MKVSAGDCLLSGEGEFEGEHRAGHRAGAHHSKPGGGPAKPLCKNFGQLPKLTGEWVDHPDPQYRGIYSQVGTAVTPDLPPHTSEFPGMTKAPLMKLRIQ